MVDIEPSKLISVLTQSGDGDSLISVLEAIQAAYPGIQPRNVHVWTLSGKAREPRIGKLWEEWRRLGVRLVEDGWQLPTGQKAFTDSGTYAPTFTVKTWKDEAAQREGPQVLSPRCTGCEAAGKPSAASTGGKPDAGGGFQSSRDCVGKSGPQAPINVW